MNKLFIGLLIVAAGAGVFFLLRKKKEQPVSESINKEWILGKWEAVSIAPLKDSSEMDNVYEFQPQVLIVHPKMDSVSDERIPYEWTKNDELLIKENSSDSSGMKFTVLKLSKDTLSVKGEEQTWIFAKAK